ncbi:MAG: phage portal protein [Oscillospiraceae bacterium]|jgi:HK97 family phage portal protein|nr:phage portal protein [Oscillospiraceae bacterium]
MGILNFFRKEKKQVKNMADPLPVDGGWAALFTGINGIDVNKAMNIPAFAASVNMICEALAMIPVKLYKSNETEEGKVLTEVFEDPRVPLLNDDTGDTLSGVEFKRAMARDYLVFGNAYAFINRVGRKIKSINYVSAGNVGVVSNFDPIFKNFNIQVQGKRFKPFEFLKLLRATEDGATGKGVLQENKELLGTAYAVLNYQQNLVEKNGNKKGFINAKTRLSKESMDAVRKSVEQLYSDKERNIIVLNEGLEFKESSNTSVEMQLNENKKSLNSEIKSVFGINIGTDGKTDYYDFLKNAVMPVISKFECALNRDLLREAEKKDYYFAFRIKCFMFALFVVANISLLPSIYAMFAHIFTFTIRTFYYYFYRCHFFISPPYFFSVLLYHISLYVFRKRPKLGGRPSRLSVLDKLMIMLGYYHDYRTMSNIAFKDGVSKSRVCDAVAWVEQTLVKNKKISLPSKRKLLKSDNNIQITIVDVTECETERPKYKQKASYSGEKNDTR